jgi:hypothetical protein
MIFCLVTQWRFANIGAFASAAFLGSLTTVSHGADQGVRGVTLTPSGAGGVQRVT